MSNNNQSLIIFSLFYCCWCEKGGREKVWCLTVGISGLSVSQSVGPQLPPRQHNCRPGLTQWPAVKIIWKQSRNSTKHFSLPWLSHLIWSGMIFGLLLSLLGFCLAGWQWQDEVRSQSWTKSISVSIIIPHSDPIDRNVRTLYWYFPNWEILTSALIRAIIRYLEIIPFIISPAITSRSVLPNSKLNYCGGRSLTDLSVGKLDIPVFSHADFLQLRQPKDEPWVLTVVQV